MSLFRKIGEKFEETKQTFTEARDNDPFVCENCEKGLTEEYETCPYCGDDAVSATS